MGTTSKVSESTVTASWREGCGFEHEKWGVYSHQATDPSGVQDRSVMKPGIEKLGSGFLHAQMPLNPLMMNPPVMEAEVMLDVQATCMEVKTPSCTDDIEQRPRYQESAFGAWYTKNQGSLRSSTTAGRLCRRLRLTFSTRR